MSNSFYRWLFALTGGVPLFVVSVTLTMIWIDPASIAGGEWLKLGAMMVIIEFLLLHSGAFMSIGPSLFKKTGHQVLWFVGFTLFYGIFFVGVALWIGQGYVVWLLSGVMLSRMLTLLILRDKRGAMLMLTRSATGMMILILTMFVALIPFPELGITEAWRSEAFGSARDSLTSHPERFLAWGIIYFTLTGMIEFFVGWRLPDWSDAEVNEGWEKLSR